MNLNFKKYGRQSHRKEKGFTAIEFVAVIVAAGILLAALFPVISDMNLDRKISTTKTELSQIARGIQKTYRQDGVYPTTIPWNDIKHHLPSSIDETNEWGQSYVLAGGGINYGSACAKTSRTSDMTLFNIAVVLPTGSDDAVLRITDDFDDCTASSAGTTVSFQYE